MVYGTARIFRSTDASAPQYNGATSGSLKNMLKAVLVDGYGSTAPLGWTTEYESGHVIVFRPGYGRIKPYIRIDDSTSFRGAHTRVYTSMFDINNGTEPMPPLEITAYLLKSDGNNSTNVPWIIIGDEAGFYLLSKWAYPSYTNTNQYGALWALQYIGFFNNIDTRNVWNFCAILGATSGYLSGLYYNFQITGTGPISAYGYSGSLRGCDFAKGSVAISARGINTSYPGVNISPGFIDINTNVRKVNGTYILSPIRLVEPKTQQVYIGCLPGLFEPLWRDYTNFVFTYANVPYEEYYDSNNDLNILFNLQNYNQGDSNSTGRVVIKTGRGFRNVL